MAREAAPRVKAARGQAAHGPHPAKAARLAKGAAGPKEDPPDETRAGQMAPVGADRQEVRSEALHVGQDVADRDAKDFHPKSGEKSAKASGVFTSTSRSVRRRPWSSRPTRAPSKPSCRSA